MVKAKPKAEFEAVEMTIAAGWFVRVMLPIGQQQPQLGGFKSEAEAKEWIERDSAEWLKGYESGKYA
jgi:hypothetical protein